MHIHEKAFFKTRAQAASIFLVFLSLALSTAFLSCVSGAAKGDIYGGLGLPSDPVPFMAKARTGTLPNGLRYYILENTRPENRAFLTLAVNAGSVLEKDDEQGLAHFVEHMAFNGTVRFPEAELLNYLRSLGMRFGPEVNAYTSFDGTVYGIEVPVETRADGIKGIPAKALAVLDDWTHAITFTPADVDDERQVIMEEYRAYLGADERVRRKILSVIFRGSPYAERLPIGLPEIIQNAPAARLENFFKTWYRPDNMAIILVGDFDGAVMEAELASHFTAPAAAGALNRPRYELPEPEKGSLEVAINTDPEYPNIRIDLYYKLAAQEPGKDLAAYREGLIDGLIQRIISFRIDEAASKPETPYTMAGTGAARYGRSSGYIILVSIAKPGAAEASLRAMLREKESIERYGFTDGEIDRAKRSLVSDLRRMVSEKDREDSNAYVRNFTSHFLEEALTPDIEWELEAATKLLPGISSADIAAAARDYFVNDDLAVCVSAPDAEQANLPTEADVRRIVAESRKARIPRPKEPRTRQDARLLKQAPLPGAILAESRDAESGAIRWELDNGATVIIRETTNRNNEVVLYALARGGITSAAPGDILSAKLASEMAEASGLGPYSRTELVRRLSDRQVSISFWINTYFRGIQGSATTEDLGTLFELINLGFTQPRMDKDAISVLLDQYRTDLAQRSEDPEAVFSDELNKTIFGNNPYYKPMELSDLSGIDRDTAMAFIRRSLNPADYTFVFVGNPDIPALRSYTETYLASIPRGQTWNTWTDPRVNRPGQIEKKIYKGKEEKSIVYMAWFRPEPYSESGSTTAEVLTEYLDIILNEKIRETMGGVYSISAFAGLSSFPPEGELSLQTVFACDPRRAGELSAAIQAELRRIADGDVNEDTFTKAVEALIKSGEDSLQSNLFIARNFAGSAVILDLPLSRLYAYAERYRSTAVPDIQDMARRILEKGPMEFILYPEGWE
ncbi:MAG: insulinase family protein [Treponema sp.]|jgi:zinc protease|nr:insulinase family protein [Treponema sp.]